MRTLVIAALIGATAGISGISAASAAPANGTVIRDNAVTSSIVQDVRYYRRWHHRYWRHRHCNRWRCW